MFIIDSSGSIKDADPGNYDLLLQFVTDIVDGLTIGPDNTRVGVIVYSNTASIHFHLNTYYDKTSVQDAIRNLDTLYIGGNTNTSGGLLTLTQVFSPANGDRADAPNVAVLITDGVSNVDPEQTIPAAQAAKAAGITIFTVGITEQINVQELRGIASEPAENHVSIVEGFADLNSIVSQALTCTVQ